MEAGRKHGGPLELEVQVVVSHLIRVLGTKLYLKEHQALLTSELSFQPLSFFFLRTWLGVCLWRCGHLVLRTPSCPMFCLLAACCFRLVQ